MRVSSVLSVCLALLLAACGRPGLLPKSGGKPYEVLVVGDSLGLLAYVLTQNVVGLPQPEPLFDLSFTDKTHYNSQSRLARSIVTLTIDSTLNGPAMTYEKNVYARPQMIIHLSAPSAEAFRPFLMNNRKHIVGLLNTMETRAQVDFLRQHNNPAAAQRVTRMFGVTMLVPQDMQSYKLGRQFVWLSNNATTGMQSICMYAVMCPENIDAAWIKHVRDSVMRANLPGERKGMYMQTATIDRLLTQPGQPRYLAAGLWQMQGDAMGGPYVIHLFCQGRRCIIAEGFVYAPEMPKRNLVKQLEAALYTIHINKETTKNNHNGNNRQ